MNDFRCNLLVIRSKEIERAATFYEVLGMQFAKHQHGNGPEHLAAESPAQTFEIYPLADDSLPTTETRIGFVVTAIDEVFEKLLQAGGKKVSPPQQSPWGRRAVVRDPDGHRVEITAET